MKDPTLSLYRQARLACLLAAIAMGVIAYPLWRVEGPAPATVANVIGLFALALAVYFHCLIKRWRSKLFVSLALALTLFGGGIVGTRTMTGNQAEAHSVYCGPQPAKYVFNWYTMTWVPNGAYTTWYACQQYDILHTTYHIQQAVLYGVAANLDGTCAWYEWWDPFCG